MDSEATAGDGPVIDAEPGADLDISWISPTDLLVPGLTILWHPETHRVGERIALPGLASGRPVEIGRLAPGFLPAAGVSPRSLGDARISRTPFVLAPVVGGLRIDPAGSRTTIEVDGEPLTGPRQLAAEALDGRLGGGVVLLLGRRIALLLHRLAPVLPRDLPHHGLVGESPGMIEIRREVRRIAELEGSVLVVGDPGTGARRVARALHAAGPRADGPFVAVDLGAVASEHVAAELFGSAEPGDSRRGAFERADGGTLCLLGVDTTPDAVQPMLLRTLETHTVRPLESETDRPIDVRVVATTGRDLHAAVDEGSFRAPLLHRLAGRSALRLPPLRERREDIGRLLIAALRRELGPDATLDGPLHASDVARLARDDWPGHVDQLVEAARRLVRERRA